jgi:hypothetical protein
MGVGHCQSGEFRLFGCRRRRAGGASAEQKERYKSGEHHPDSGSADPLWFRRTSLRTTGHLDSTVVAVLQAGDNRGNAAQPQRLTVF